MMTQPYDIVGYTFMGETYTPEGILEVYRGLQGIEAFDQVTEGYQSPDQALSFLGSHLGFDYDDESSYDSSQFPKRIFRDQVEPSTVLLTAWDVICERREDDAVLDAIMELLQGNPFRTR